MYPASLPRDRIAAAILVALVHGLLAYALIAGLRIDIVRATSETLRAFDVREDPAPPPEPPPVAAREPAGEAAPPAPKAEPAPVVAPTPVVAPPEPPPIVAAPVAAAGNDGSAGAARFGRGTGSGGLGRGTGAGGSGRGMGGEAVPARHIAGRIVNSDYPRAARRDRAEGKTFAMFVVDTAGRATRCRIMEPSGHPELDAATCDLIERRFRFEPARNGRGETVEDVKGWEQLWWLEGR